MSHFVGEDSILLTLFSLEKVNNCSPKIQNEAFLRKMWFGNKNVIVAKVYKMIQTSDIKQTIHLSQCVKDALQDVGTCRENMKSHDPSVTPVSVLQGPSSRQRVASRLPG